MVEHDLSLRTPPRLLQLLTQASYVPCRAEPPTHSLRAGLGWLLGGPAVGLVNSWVLTTAHLQGLEEAVPLRAPEMGKPSCDPQKSPDTPGSPEGNTEGPGTASSEPLLPS